MEKKELMKTILEKAWDKLEKKEELLDIIAKKAPEMSEEERLAFAKVYAYAQEVKKSEKNHKPSHHEEYHNKSLDEVEKDPSLSVKYEHHKGGKDKGHSWHSIEIHKDGELKSGFGYHRMTPAIARAKAMSQKSVIKKSEELAKEEKGVHKPAYIKGISSGSPKDTGTSKTGFDTRVLNSIKNKSPKAEIKGMKKIVKDRHKKVLAEQKTMPKPNLPKSEMAKEEKGVHKPHFMAGKKTGTSDVGARFSGGKPSKELKEYATKEHKKVLAEQKAMPKPNLPKSEMAKSKVEQMKLDIKKPMKKEEKGVHPEASSAVAQGKSIRGNMARATKDAKKKGAWNHEKELKETAARHSKSNIEYNKQNKPNLPKSEMAKSKSDETLSWGEKRKVRRARVDLKPEGIHNNYHNEKGVSAAGHEVRFGKKPEHNMYSVSSNKTIASQGKQKHKKVLAEQKAMPKPNLPKSEKID